MARKVDEAAAKLASAMAHQSAIEALIAHLKLQIAKLKREQYCHEKPTQLPRTGARMKEAAAQRVIHCNAAPIGIGCGLFLPSRSISPYWDMRQPQGHMAAKVLAVLTRSVGSYQLSPKPNAPMSLRPLVKIIIIVTGISIRVG